MISPQTHFTNSAFALSMKAKTLVMILLSTPVIRISIVLYLIVQF